MTSIHTDSAEMVKPLLQGTRYIMEGRTGKLKCVGVGYPPPLVQWRKLNGSFSDRVSITNMSMSRNVTNITRVIAELIFTSVSREDTGDYECSVSSKIKNITRKLSLIIQCTYVIKIS